MAVRRIGKGNRRLADQARDASREDRTSDRDQARRRREAGGRSRT